MAALLGTGLDIRQPFIAGSVTNAAKFAIVVALTFGLFGQSQAQAPRAKGAPPPAHTTPAPSASAAANAPPPGWVARCTSAGRTTSLECAIEQAAVLTKTGQLILLINIRVPADTRAPIALVQLPLGLNLPAGATLQIDDRKVLNLQIQTCEARGCYANLPVAPDMLDAMRSGKQLKVSFQNLAKETITIPMPLADFAAAYEKIK
ncbi:invasion associated locus B family protein [Bradyrhizobium sp. JYMT SZCCT0428]|uniref:invasion associated locus B family protein n=1 Tax=Bradyrhizobium sp. JYMT SZCCT0428 TaxID=2807673 RepID=UPI001BAA5E21|nr:invasion associated locus B family protein [Bradyrhizobium sp. JYMT SZCCT0428]MBR1157206.1 invasion associated locus B family protein [Bradyrhizobium sp. JYMT SZCCT0428]